MLKVIKRGQASSYIKHANKSSLSISGVKNTNTDNLYKSSYMVVVDAHHTALASLERFRLFVEFI
jgi:hypothetical protein